MRNGFKSSRGAILGTIGGVPICLVGVVGFATVAIGVGPFVNSFYRSRRLQIVRCTWPEFLKLFSPRGPLAKARPGAQPLAANFCVFALAAYLSRQAFEQKCTISPPSRKGMASTSATCTPHTGSRTSRRAPPGVSAVPRTPATEAPPTDLAGALEPPRSIHPTTRRNRATLQETITSQNTNRITRARKFIIRIVRSTAHNSKPRKAAVCRVYATPKG